MAIDQGNSPRPNAPANPDMERFEVAAGRPGSDQESKGERRRGRKEEAPVAAPAPVPPTEAELAFGELQKIDKAANPKGYQEALKKAVEVNPTALSSLGSAIAKDPTLQQRFKISAQSILSFTNSTGAIDFEAVGRQAMAAFKPDGQIGKMTNDVDLALRSSGTTPTSIASAPSAAGTSAPVAQEPVAEAPQEEKKGRGGKVVGFFREAGQQIKKDFGQAREEIRKDFGVGQGADSPGQEPKRGGVLRAVGGIAGAVVKEVVPGAGLVMGAKEGLEALNLGANGLNFQDRSNANAILSQASIFVGGKGMKLVPEGISRDVLNKVLDISFPQGRDITAADLGNLTADEQKLVLHRQEIGKKIESSHEVNDAEWDAQVKAAMARDYNLPPDANQKIMSLSDYLGQSSGGASGGATPREGRAGGATSAPSAATSTQYAAYVSGREVSADLAVSSSLKDKHGDPVILNADALVRFESAMAAHGLKIGKDVVVTSSFRTHEEQTALYRSYVSGNNPYPVAQPGYSKHQSGFALDIRGSENPAIQAAMKDAGFMRPIPGSDPVHWVYVGPVSKGSNPVVAKA